MRAWRLLTIWLLCQPSAVKALPLAQGITQTLGAEVPADAALVDERQRPVKFGDFLGQRPLVLVFYYRHCSGLCPMVLQALAASLRQLDFSVGDAYDVIAVSIDPRDTAPDGGRRMAGTGGWHFLSGRQTDVKNLAAHAGFPYDYDLATAQFRHPTGIFVLTPEGRVSKAWLGISYDARTLRLSLVEAAHGRIGTISDQVRLFCHHLGAARGRYAAAVASATKVLGTLSMAGLGISLWLTTRRRRGSNP